MAQKNKSENYDALGSIFDFIFKESKKSPDKRRPIKPTGISGESMLTDALVASLEMPGVFLSNTMIKEYNRMLDIKLGEVKFDEYGGLSISTGKIIDLLKDPAGYVQKSIDDINLARKQNKVRFLGEVMDDFLTTAWAHQYGDQEAKEIALARAGANEKAEAYKVQRAIGQNIRTDSLSNSDFMRDRSIELIGRRTFGNKWDSMGEQEKYEFIEKFANEKDLSGGVQKEFIQRYLAQRYGREAAEGFGRATHTKTEDIDISSPELYRQLEKDHLMSKIGPLKNASAGSPEEKQRKMYEKSLLLINMRNESQMQDLKLALKDEKDPARRQEIEGAIRDGEIARKLLGNRNNFIGGLGRIEGYVNSINDVWGGLSMKNLVPSIINGDFFNEGRNSVLCPTTTKQAFGVRILRAEETTGKGSSIKNAYNEMGESLYYMTPKSLINTFLFNGEGFVFLLSKQLESLDDIEGLSQKELFANFEKLSGKKMDEYMRTTLLKLKTSGISEKNLRRIEYVFKRSKTLKAVANIFGTGNRIKGKIESFFKNKITKKARVNFARMLLKNATLKKWMIKSGAGKLLGTWITQGGLKTLVRSLVTAIAGAAGLVLTPLGSAFVTAVTWVLTDMLMKLTKVFMSLGVLIAFGIVGVFILLSGIANKAVADYNVWTYSYRSVIPGKVEICPDYEFTEPTPENPEDDYEEEDVVMPPLTGEKCILGTSSGVSCTQGWVDDGTCFSHANISGAKPVDLGFSGGLYAPQFCGKPGTSCKVTSSANYPCKSPAGDYVKFEAFDGTNTYTFLFVHVKLK